MAVFDEPEAGIDLWSFRRLAQTFGELHEQSNATIVIISHQERILELADDIILVADGRVETPRSKDEVLAVDEEVQVQSTYRGRDRGTCRIL